jgi:hypothetical protein
VHHDNNTAGPVDIAHVRKLVLENCTVLDSSEMRCGDSALLVVLSTHSRILNNWGILIVTIPIPTKEAKRLHDT